MKLALYAAAAVSALIAATPASATIVAVLSSSDQGFLVHGNGGGADTGPLIYGDLNVTSNGNAQDPRVFFNADTTNDTNATVQDSADLLTIQQGGGQAEIDGAEISGTVTEINKMNIFLDALPLQNPATATAGDTFGYIELALVGDAGATLKFVLTDNQGDLFTFQGVNTAGGTYTLGTGETKFAFNAIDGQSIRNLYYEVLTGGQVESVRQVRLDLASSAPIPEPATWAMMIFGFGAIGGALRRKKAAAPRVRFNFA